jgi:hypothetical protein
MTQRGTAREHKYITGTGITKRGIANEEKYLTGT